MPSILFVLFYFQNLLHFNALYAFHYPQLGLLSLFERPSINHMNCYVFIDLKFKHNNV